MIPGNVISTDDLAALSASTGRYLRKVLKSVIGSSEAMIPAKGFPGPDEVHDIRVNMKKCRAILKLLRASPGAEFYSRENCALRNISLLFSSSRENEVLKKTLRLMSKNHPELFTNNVECLPQFVDPAATAFRLAAASPMIDAGAFLTRTAVAGV